MTTELPCIIVDATAAHNWEDLSFGRSPASDPRAPDYCCQRIPLTARPTVLHPNRRVAEAEALRLNAANHGRRYVVFEAVTAAQAVEVPTHVNIHGVVMQSKAVATLVDIDDGVPF